MTSPHDVPAAMASTNDVSFQSRMVTSLPPKPEVSYLHATQASKQPQPKPRGFMPPTTQANLAIQHVAKEDLTLSPKQTPNDVIMIMPPVRSKTFVGASKPAQAAGNINGQSLHPVSAKPPAGRPVPYQQPVRHSAPLLRPLTVPRSTSFEERQAGLMKAPAATTGPDVSNSPAKREADVKRRSLTTGPQWKQSKYFELDAKPDDTNLPSRQSRVAQSFQSSSKQPMAENRNLSNHNNNHEAKPAAASTAAPPQSASTSTGANRPEVTKPSPVSAGANRPEVTKPSPVSAGANRSEVTKPSPVLAGAGIPEVIVEQEAAPNDAIKGRKTSKEGLARRRGSNASTSSKSSRTSRGSRKGKEECSLM